MRYLLILFILFSGCSLIEEEQKERKAQHDNHRKICKTTEITHYFKEIECKYKSGTVVFLQVGHGRSAIGGILQ